MNMALINLKARARFKKLRRKYLPSEVGYKFGILPWDWLEVWLFWLWVKGAVRRCPKCPHYEMPGLSHRHELDGGR